MQVGSGLIKINIVLLIAVILKERIFNKKNSPDKQGPINRYQFSADSCDLDKPIGHLTQTSHGFYMCCKYYACKSIQHNLFVFFALCAGHSYVHDKGELSSFILRMLI